jgi:RNA polymerase subunit RPABC4/transcription elongation factor Spt4
MYWYLRKDKPMTNEIKNCPNCGGFIPNNETPGAYFGALSRKDNKTEICSSCGTAEALLDWIFSTEEVK